jgi:hypothetical protein
VYYLEEPDISSWSVAEGPKQPIYRVSFFQRDIWEGYPDSIQDSVSIEIWFIPFSPSIMKEVSEAGLMCHC